LRWVDRDKTAVTYSVLSVFEAYERLVAVKAGELGGVAGVLVSIELLFGEDVAAGL